MYSTAFLRFHFNSQTIQSVFAAYGRDATTTISQRFRSFAEHDARQHCVPS